MDDEMKKPIEEEVEEVDENLDEEINEEEAEDIDHYFRPSAEEVEDEIEVVEMLDKIDSEWYPIIQPKDRYF